MSNYWPCKVPQSTLCLPACWDSLDNYLLKFVHARDDVLKSFWSFTWCWLTAKDILCPFLLLAAAAWDVASPLPVENLQSRCRRTKVRSIKAWKLWWWNTKQMFALSIQCVITSLMADAPLGNWWMWRRVSKTECLLVDPFSLSGMMQHKYRPLHFLFCLYSSCYNIIATVQYVLHCSISPGEALLFSLCCLV